MYFMYYQDQLVLTGQLNEVGAISGRIFHGLTGLASNWSGIPDYPLVLNGKEI